MINGIPVNVDLDYFRGNEQQLKRFIQESWGVSGHPFVVTKKSRIGLGIGAVMLAGTVAIALGKKK